MFGSRLGRNGSWICSSCVRQRILLTARQKRSISQRYVAKVDSAEEQWKGFCEEIEAGKRQSMLRILEERGYINAIAGGSRDDLNTLMNQKRIGAYVGVDPTAPSLHIGHLLPLMALFWMYVHGFQAVTLLGGATAGVGDPTGRTTTRDKLPRVNRQSNMITMHYQFKSLWANIEEYGRKYDYKWEWSWRRHVANNNAWLNKLPLLELLRLLGEGTRIGEMLRRETASTRMQSGNGLSFSEFTYPLLQGYDWWHMYSHFQLNGIQLQIGGSDQYGNIMAGIDVVNCIRRNHHEPKYRQETDEFLDRPMGFTVPLLTTAAGEKFGKTAGNAIWLDKDMTSAFDLYQFFLRSSDDDVHRYLKLFTFIPLANISALMAEHQTDPSKRLAQRTLAREALEVIHGKIVATETEAQHKLMFSNKPLQTAYPRPSFAPTPENSNPRELESSQYPKSSFKNPYSKAARATYMNPILNPSAGPTPPLPSANVTLPRSLVHNQSMSRIFYSAGLVSSRSEGHRLLSAHGAYVGSKPGIQHGDMPDHVEYTRAQNWEPQKTEQFLLGEGKDLLVLRAGKWRVKVVNVVEDELFEREGRDAPGWRQRKEEMAREKGEMVEGEKEVGRGKGIVEARGNKEQKMKKEDEDARSVIRKVVQGEDPRMRSVSWETPPPPPAS